MGGKPIRCIRYKTNISKDVKLSIIFENTILFRSANSKTMANYMRTLFTLNRDEALKLAEDMINMGDTTEEKHYKSLTGMNKVVSVEFGNAIYFHSKFGIAGKPDATHTILDREEALRLAQDINEHYMKRLLTGE